MSATASDETLLELLRGERGQPEAVALARKPYRYATSSPLEELDVRMSDGTRRALIFKDLSFEHLLPDARASKPRFLHQPLRELDTYRHILRPCGLGPRCVAIVANGHENWLLIEKIPGVELWQVGELSVWEAVATWLGRFHARFASEIRALRADNPHLLDHSKEWFRSWADRAGAALGQSDDSRAAIVRRGLTRYDGIAGSLAALPRTFVHGELYPSNVLVVTTSQPLGIFPVDWEMAAIGPGLIDLAALIGGWERDEQRRLEEAYFAGLPDDAAESANVDEDITRCRLHLALQWLGWSSNWTPPIEHRHDWIGEAHSLMGELGIV